MPFMLKGSLLSRQYYKNKRSRMVADMDYLYFGETRDDEPFMSAQLSRWVDAVTEVRLDDGVDFKRFKDNQFWRCIEYVMHDDFPTVSTDLSCTVKNTENPEVGLDISWGLPLNIKPVSLLYQPLEGEPFEIKYTTPLSLQISWKLHQCVVRPRLKDMIDIHDLLRDTQASEEIIKEAANEYIKECQKGNINPDRIKAFMDGSVIDYLNNQYKLWGLLKKKAPLPHMGELLDKRLAFLRHSFTDYHHRYNRVDDIVRDFVKTLKAFNFRSIIDDLL